VTRLLAATAFLQLAMQCILPDVGCLALAGPDGTLTPAQEDKTPVTPGNSIRTEIVVSPQGNDASGGTALEPVATLHRAQELARIGLAQNQKVKVTLLGGVYRLGDTLVFTPQDSAPPSPRFCGRHRRARR
jgi:hypothetical protein